MLKKLKNKKTLLITLLVSLALVSLACNLLPGQQPDPEPVVEEPAPTDPPEPEESAFVPQQTLQLDFEDSVSSVAVSQDGALLASGIFMQLDVWNREDGALAHAIETTHTVESMAFSPDGQSVASGLSVGGVNIYSIPDGQIIHDLHGGHNNYLALSPDGTQLATGNRSGLVWVWQTDSGELLLELDPGEHLADFSEWLTALAYSPDGATIAAGHWDGHIFLWGAESGELIRVLEPETQYCNAWELAFSPDGQHLAVGGGTVDFADVIKIWNVADGSIQYALDDFGRGGSRNTPVAYAPDGTLLAAGAVEGIYIWSLPEYELLYTLPIEEKEDSDWVTDLVFTPDGQYLLASYWDSYAILWQVQE